MHKINGKAAPTAVSGNFLLREKSLLCSACLPGKWVACR